MESINIFKGFDECDIKGCTLIVPSVAVGNVGQLACDLLISSLQMKKVSSVYSPALIPVLGYDPYDLKSENLSSCCELYKSDRNKIVVLQIRAPLVYKYAQVFLEDVVKIIKEKNIKEIVILTSSYAHEKKHIPTSQFRYIANDNCELKTRVESLNWLQHSYDAEGRILGGGFASMLYDIINSKNVPCLVLYKYSSEGDNIPDAYEMIEHLSSILQLFKDSVDVSKQLIQPASWKLLFGPPPPKDIY